MTKHADGSKQDPYVLPRSDGARRAHVAQSSHTPIPSRNSEGVLVDVQVEGLDASVSLPNEQR